MIARDTAAEPLDIPVPSFILADPLVYLPSSMQSAPRCWWAALRAAATWNPWPQVRKALPARRRVGGSTLATSRRVSTGFLYWRLVEALKACGWLQVSDMSKRELRAALLVEMARARRGAAIADSVRLVVKGRKATLFFRLT